MPRTVLSAFVLSVALGIVARHGGRGPSTSTSQSIVELIELALVLTLFTDGMFVERELLLPPLEPVARWLVITMPITIGSRPRRQDALPGAELA